MQLVKKTKKLRNGPINLQTKFEPNLCKHARATAVFVHMAILAIKECSNQIALKTKKFHTPLIYIS